VNGYGLDVVVVRKYQILKMIEMHYNQMINWIKKKIINKIYNLFFNHILMSKIIRVNFEIFEQCFEIVDIFIFLIGF
jgi:hypothetical protein